mmetsp:Transcript_3064/g.4629  ORF Transcript_3064/g.4629 Transcript_3064/m.4629 type:complete len:190 (+) Transcript_3064:65-634(+)
MTSEETEEAVSCRQVWNDMNVLLQNRKMIRNFHRCIDMADDSFVVETDLFSVAALNVYSAYNLENSIDEKDRQTYFSAHRGGSQGDYREGMKAKITNVVDCLHRYPQSKRAVITVCNNPKPRHSSDEDAKCMREIHFYLDDGNILNATVWMRAQAAEIFPKNIHFVGSLMKRVAEQLTETRCRLGSRNL